MAFTNKKLYVTVKDIDRLMSNMTVMKDGVEREVSNITQMVKGEERPIADFGVEEYTWYVYEVIEEIRYYYHVYEPDININVAATSNNARTFSGSLNGTYWNDVTMVSGSLVGEGEISSDSITSISDLAGLYTRTGSYWYLVGEVNDYGGFHGNAKLHRVTGTVSAGNYLHDEYYDEEIEEGQDLYYYYKFARTEVHVEKGKKVDEVTDTDPEAYPDGEVWEEDGYYYELQ